MKIKYSIFIPSYVPSFIKNTQIYFTPIDKGTIILATDSKEATILNRISEDMRKDILELYEQLPFSKENGIIINFEVPPCWEFGVFIASILGVIILNDFLNNKTIYIQESIDKCYNYLSYKGVPVIFVYPFLFQGSSKINFESSNIEKIKDKKSIFVIGLNEESKYKPSLEDLKKFKINENGEFRIGSITIKKTSHSKLIKTVEEYLNIFTPERLLVARSYFGGIKLYDHKSLISSLP